jgi:hypothetical protein
MVPSILALPGHEAVRQVRIERLGPLLQLV